MASGSLEQSILDAFEDDEDVSSDEHGHLAGDVLLMDLADAVLLRALSRLSAEDVLAAAQTCRRLAELCDDGAIWRSLFRHRWPHGTRGASLSEVGGPASKEAAWKRLYLAADAAEVSSSLRQLRQQAPEKKSLEEARKGGVKETHLNGPASPARAAAAPVPLPSSRSPSSLSSPSSLLSRGWQPDALTLLFNQAARAPRSQAPPLPDAEFFAPGSPREARRPPGQDCAGGCARWRHARGALWECEACGAGHLCDGSCSLGVAEEGSDALVCPLTGRCSERLLASEGGAEGAGEGDWDAEDGACGRLGRAFFAGYHAASADEVRKKFGTW